VTDQEEPVVTLDQAQDLVRRRTEADIRSDRSDERPRDALLDPSIDARSRNDGGIAGCGVLAARLQQEVALEAARQVLRSNDHWTMAARRVEALERLGSRLAEIERDEELRRAANEIDDLVLARFVRDMRSGA